MIVTGLFFAEYARVSEDMLDILGGVWDTCTVPRDTRMLECRLVALLQTSPDDIGKDFPATLEVLDANGEHIVNQRGLQIPGAGFTGENRFWFLPMQMVFRNEGRHNFILSAGGATASVGLRIAFG
ncbi:hypothetical protein HQO44_21990 [Rhodococcus fascians]|nr:hypothetical protein [Rhodococcus fascians]